MFLSPGIEQRPKMGMMLCCVGFGHAYNVRSDGFCAFEVVVVVFPGRAVGSARRFSV